MQGPTGMVGGGAQKMTRRVVKNTGSVGDASDRCLPPTWGVSAEVKAARLRFAAMWMGLAGPAATEPWKLWTTDRMRIQSLPALRLLKDGRAPCSLLSSYHGPGLGGLAVPPGQGQRPRKRAEGIVGVVRRLQAGPGCRTFRLGNRGKACWAQARFRDSL